MESRIHHACKLTTNNVVLAIDTLDTAIIIMNENFLPYSEKPSCLHATLAS